MSGFVITEGSIVQCPHQFPVAPQFTDIHVKVEGKAVVLEAKPYNMATCANTSQSKCVSGTWTKGASRVTASGIPVAINTGISVVTPTPGGKFSVGLNQPSVRAE